MSQESGVPATCSPEMLLDQCRALRATLDFEAALQLLETGEAEFPNCADLPACRAELLNELQRPQQALDAAERALACDPRCARALFARGFALMLQDRLREAHTTLCTLLDIDPTYPDAAWFAAGLLRRIEGEFNPEVLCAFETALETDPDNPYLQIEHASLLRALGRHTEARAIYAVVCQPDTCPDEHLRTEAAFNLALVCMVQGDQDSARNALQSVLATAPDYPDARELYETLRD